MVEPVGEFRLLLGRERFAGFDLFQDAVFRRGLDRLFPFGDVISLVHALAFGTDFDIRNRLQPLVGQPEFDQFL